MMVNGTFGKIMFTFLFTCCLPLIAAAQQCPTLVWSDEFDGSAVDPANWSFQIGDGCAEGICGWGNNELQSYPCVAHVRLGVERRDL